VNIASARCNTFSPHTTVYARAKDVDDLASASHPYRHAAEYETGFRLIEEVVETVGSVRKNMDRRAAEGDGLLSSLRISEQA
jgi:hypothetical protein